ncbi:MAG TPA: NUDIX domain-containing protein [bacterium]|mgnify:CR=1 FL=1|nr:NUDIX domain-containing protein [bacterium]
MNISISASAIIYNEKNQVLIAKRSPNKRLDPNLWETIGGTVEFGESPLECLKREIGEELGCKLSNIKLFDVYSYVNKELNRQIISIQYVGTIKTKPKFNTEEIAELKWIAEIEISKLKFSMNCKERVLDYFKRIKNHKTP